jgi:uncharacterized cupredoxin-like copper-binding protein
MDSMDSMASETPAVQNTTNDAGSANADASATPTAVAQQQESSTSTTVAATLCEWAIDLSQSEVPAGKITFTVVNTGMMAHNLTVLDSSGVTIDATPTFRGSDGPQTLEVELQPGTYTLICSLPGHAQRGQKTELVVK